MRGLLISVLFLVTFVILVSHAALISNMQKYMQKRAKLLENDKKSRLGANLKLTRDEMIVDKILLQEKRKIMEDARINRTLYWPAASFYKSKPLMENTTIFKIIRRMPKGAALHLHDLSIASIPWLVKNITYRNNVYMCLDQSYRYKLNIFAKQPTNQAGDSCRWKRVQKAREEAKSPEAFDKMLIKNISFLASDPLEVFEDTNKAWDRFKGYFSQVIQLVYHKEVYGDYFRHALEEFYADNVQYFELRAQLWGIRDLNESVHDSEFGLKIYKQELENFLNKKSDFSGVKIIMSGLRSVQSDIPWEVKEAIRLHKKYPNFMLGYDLVGQEDPSQSLLFYIKDLLYPSSRSPPKKLPFFFHAAETNWKGTSVDYNLVDALLLNTTRIGHGYGLPKHPKLVELVKEQQAAVEVNPISNQVLGLVSDLRNHAMVPLLTDDFPVVVSSDDPATWESLPLTHDFFVAFMTMSGEDEGLAFLKQLAINSIKYSAMNKTEKVTAIVLWETKWNHFIKNVLLTFPPPRSDCVSCQQSIQHISKASMLPKSLTQLVGERIQTRSIPRVFNQM